MSHQFTAKVGKKGERHNGITTKKIKTEMKELVIDEDTQVLKKLQTVLRTLGFEADLKYEVSEWELESPDSHLEVYYEGVRWDVWKWDDSFKVCLGDDKSYYRIFVHGMLDVVGNFWDDLKFENQKKRQIYK